MNNANNATVDLLCAFVNQRDGISFAEYGEDRDPNTRICYSRDKRSAAQAKKHFFELLYLAQRRLGNQLEDKVIYELTKVSTSRLTLTETGKLQYITGQYFPTEYRPAAARILANIIWKDYANETEANTPNPLYKDGHAIRKAIGRVVSRSVKSNYFN